MRLLIAFASTVLFAWPALAEGNPRVRQRLAEAKCSHCHAVGRIGVSPLPIAPPFRMLHTRYPVESLAEALAEGIMTGHPSMPEFRLDPDQIENLIAYLKTLER